MLVSAHAVLKKSFIFIQSTEILGLVKHQITRLTLIKVCVVKLRPSIYKPHLFVF